MHRVPVHSLDLLALKVGNTSSTVVCDGYLVLIMCRVSAPLGYKVSGSAVELAASFVLRWWETNGSLWWKWCPYFGWSKGYFEALALSAVPASGSE